MRRAMLISSLLGLASCGPVKSGTLLVDAQAELSAARLADGERHAPFEFAAAEEYIHRAREEQSYAEFERAIVFAEKSRDCARLARKKSELTLREEVGAVDAKRSPRGALGPSLPGEASCKPGPADRDAPNADPSLVQKLKLPKDPPESGEVPASAPDDTAGGAPRVAPESKP
jgi:hypothetical protein